MAWFFSILITKNDSPEDEYKRRQTDDKEIAQIGKPVDGYPFSDQIKNQCFRENDHIQDDEYNNIPNGFPGYIFAIRHRADIDYIRRIQLFIPFQEVGGQKYADNSLNDV